MADGLIYVKFGYVKLKHIGCSTYLAKDESGNADSGKTMICIWLSEKLR